MCLLTVFDKNPSFNILSLSFKNVLSNDRLTQIHQMLDLSREFFHKRIHFNLPVIDDILHILSFRDSLYSINALLLDI